MYTDKRNGLQLIALLKEFGIDHIVFSPGNRNTPISHSVEEDNFFTAYMITDERSAAFFALGLIQKLNKPVAVSCTSGSAMMNYGPALAEAYCRNLPLLLITCDLPLRLLGQAEPQMIPQFGTFDNLLKKSVRVPEANNEDDEWLANRLINEALLELDRRYPGPVQINIEFGGNLHNFTVAQLPLCRKINRMSVLSENWEQDYCRELCGNKKIMIILGQKTLYGDKEKELLSEFISRFNCVVIADYLSNFRHENVVQHALPLFERLSYPVEQEYVPDIIISLYENYTFHWAIKPFIARNKQPQKHWHVSPKGDLVDKFRCLTDVFEMPEVLFFDKLLSVAPEGCGANTGAFVTKWKTLLDAYKEPEPPFSDLYVVGELFRKIPKNSSLHIANSSSVRLAQLYALDESIRVFCNRGVDGIDGCVSTAVGYAALHDELTFLLIGDLAFFYDNNGLWNNYKKGNLRVLLNNNHGASLFVQAFGFSVSDFIGAKHDNAARGYAESLGLMYLSANNQEELERQLPLFTQQQSDKPILLEAFSPIKEDAKAVNDLYAANRSVVSKAAKYIPADVRKIIKKLL
jgi:2-succinyl-5-enolpyruvyl-6-hydroxy-3-cyclohexene-1-carboxylate synthase